MILCTCGSRKVARLMSCTSPWTDTSGRSSARLVWIPKCPFELVLRPSRPRGLVLSRSSLQSATTHIELAISTSSERTMRSWRSGVITPDRSHFDILPSVNGGDSYSPQAHNCTRVAVPVSNAQLVCFRNVSLFRDHFFRSKLLSRGEGLGGGNPYVGLN